MEKGPILVIVERVIDLLIPYHSSIGALAFLSRSFLAKLVLPYRYIHQFDPIGIANQVVREHASALEPSVDPSLGIWICDIETYDRHGMNLVGRFRDSAFDAVLICLGQYGGHPDLLHRSVLSFQRLHISLILAAKLIARAAVAQPRL